MDNAVDSQKRSVLFVAGVGSFVTPFMASSLNVALPSLGSEFGMGAVALSWVATIYILSAAVFLVPLGRIADIHGRKKVYTYGIMVYTLCSLLCAASPTAEFLIASRFLQGIGGAMIFGTGMAIITSVFPPGERGKAIGVTIAAVYLGMSIGPTVGGALTQTLGWRSIFYINVPMGVATFAIAVTKLKGEWAEASGQRFDMVGAVIYGLMLTSIIYGFTLIPASTGIFLICIGVILLLCFILWVHRCSSPILDISLFKENKVFAYSNIAALVNYSATTAVAFLLSLYLQYVKGMSPIEAGFILVCQPIIQAVFSPLAGRISDKFDAGAVASIGMAATAVGLTLFTFITPDTSLHIVIAGLAVMGVGFALFSSPNTNAIMSSVLRKNYGVASGMVSTMRLVGMSLSMGIAMLILSIFVGHVQISEGTNAQLVAGIKTAFVLFAVLCYAGIFASFNRVNVKTRIKSKKDL